MHERISKFAAEPISDNINPVGNCYIDIPCENCEVMQKSGSFWANREKTVHKGSSLDTAEDQRF